MHQKYSLSKIKITKWTIAITLLSLYQKEYYCYSWDGFQVDSIGPLLSDLSYPLGNFAYESTGRQKRNIPRWCGKIWIGSKEMKLPRLTWGNWLFWGVIAFVGVNFLWLGLIERYIPQWVGAIIGLIIGFILFRYGPRPEK